ASAPEQTRTAMGAIVSQRREAVRILRTPFPGHRKAKAPKRRPPVSTMGGPLSTVGARTFQPTAPNMWVARARGGGQNSGAEENWLLRRLEDERIGELDLAAGRGREAPGLDDRGHTLAHFVVTQRVRVDVRRGDLADRADGEAQGDLPGQARVALERLFVTGGDRALAAAECVGHDVRVERPVDVGRGRVLDRAAQGGHALGPLLARVDVARA